MAILKLGEPTDLSENAVALLREAVRRFALNKAAPTFRELERHFVRDFDAYVTRGEIQRVIGEFAGRPDEPVKLSALAFAYANEHLEALECYWALIKLAINHYFGDTGRPIVRAEELKALGFDERAVRSARDILERDYFIANSADKSLDEWEFEVSPSIREFANARTLAEYLSMRRAKLREALRRADESLAPSQQVEAAATNASSSFEPNTAFILMRINRADPMLDDVKNAFKDAFAEFGIGAVRADDIQHNDLITDIVLERIRTSEFIVADLTEERPNVYYEVGFAHALGKRPILVRRRGANIHFDLAGYNVIDFDNITNLKELLRTRLAVLTNRTPSLN